MTQAHTVSNFSFPKQIKFYRGKVRDVYSLENDIMIMIASDRISAFDVVLPHGIPFKGQVLNQIAASFLNATKNIVPNWLLATPDPMVSIGLLCEPYKVEMVVRGYLAGHAAREYKLGKRTICGVTLPDGLKENDQLPHPIITPTTKANVGHDEDISRESIIANNIVEKGEYEMLEKLALKLFAKGSEMADDKGLILVDTKYEFGNYKGTIYLIDEIHTPDSSRYFYKDGYETRQNNGEKQKQLSKEFVREWLIENNFQGKEGQQIPAMTAEWITQISNRYIELYETIIGSSFVKPTETDIEKRIFDNTISYLNKHC